MPAQDGQKESHFEIEWRSKLGKDRSGQWYRTRHAAEALALECGAAEIVHE